MPADTTDSKANPNADLLSDCRRMLQFGLKEGRLFPDELLQGVARLDCSLKKKGLRILSAMPLELVPDEASEPGTPPPASQAELLLKVHAGLSKVVLPATALTLETSEPTRKKWRLLGGTPLIVKLAIPVAFVCALIFVVTTSMIAYPASRPIAERVAADTAKADADQAGKAEVLAKKEADEARTAANTERTNYEKAIEGVKEAEAAAVKATSESSVKAKSDVDNAKKSAEKAKLELDRKTDVETKKLQALQSATEPANKARAAAKDANAKAEEAEKAIVQIAPEPRKFREWLRSCGVTDDGLNILNAFVGAALGAAFYILIKTHPYLLNRSFDPKFDAAYASRFMIGIVAGVLLATVLRKFVSEKSALELTPGLLAILGGYAAEFVEQALQRMVEVLLAAIRGDGKAQADAAAKEKSVEVRNKLVDLEKLKDQPEAFKKALAELHTVLQRTT